MPVPSDPLSMWMIVPLVLVVGENGTGNGKQTKLHYFHCFTHEFGFFTRRCRNGSYSSSESPPLKDARNRKPNPPPVGRFVLIISDDLDLSIQGLDTRRKKRTNPTSTQCRSSEVPLRVARVGAFYIHGAIADLKYRLQLSRVTYASTHSVPHARGSRLTERLTTISVRELRATAAWTHLVRI